MNTPDLKIHLKKKQPSDDIKNININVLIVLFSFKEALLR